jgi:hypothetical protein
MALTLEPSYNLETVMRVRFRLPSGTPEPTTFPTLHPFWTLCHGMDGYELMAYVTGTEQLLTLWPDAEDVVIDEMRLNSYTYTETYPRPSWFTIQRNGEVV